MTLTTKSYGDTSPEDCQELCKLAGGCVAYNYVLETCFLKYNEESAESSDTCTIREEEKEVPTFTNPPTLPPTDPPRELSSDSTTYVPQVINKTIPTKLQATAPKGPLIGPPTSHPTNSTTEPIPTSTLYAAIIAPVLGCCFIIPLCWWMHINRKSENDPTTSQSVLPSVIQAQGVPTHCTLMKNETLKERAKELAENHVLLEQEFKSLEVYVQATVVKETSVANLELNIPHNRYKDIGNHWRIY